MKRVIFFTLVFALGITTSTFAQTKSKQQTTAHRSVEKSTTKKGSSSGASQNGSQDSVTLTSSSASQAYGGRFSISDLTIRRLNQRASGQDVQISSSGIVGMPKGTYGFANGKILLRPTTATSSGTNFGSGAVGTGTTIMGVGTGENTPGINGKSPYAGPWLWGSKVPGGNLPATDSTRRQ